MKNLKLVFFIGILFFFCESAVGGKSRFNIPVPDEKGRETLTQPEHSPSSKADSDEKRQHESNNQLNVDDIFTNTIGMTFKLVDAGDFWMGTPEGGTHDDDDEIYHKVKISKPFYMQITEVTQKQWKELMGTNPSAFDSFSLELPVERVSWYDTQEFIKKLTERENRNYRLPTEAEWEYVCRAGTNTPYSFGHTINKKKANFGNFYERTLKVKSFEPNKWGFYDMHGNVNEWCMDWYATYPDHYVVDPKVTSNFSKRKVTRGGGWNDIAEHCRSANRQRVRPGVGFANNIGFRLSLTIDK